MQVQIALKSSTKTGQIKSVSKYEMLYIPTATALIPAQCAFSNKNAITAKTVTDASEFNGMHHQLRLYLAKNEWKSMNEIQQNCLNSGVLKLLKKSRWPTIHRILKVLLTLIVCLWWIGSIGFVHCIAQSQQIDGPLSTTFNLFTKSSVTAAAAGQQHQQKDSNSHLQFSSIQARRTAFQRDRIRRSLSSMRILNILKSDTRSKNHLDEHRNDSTGLFRRHIRHRQQQHQQQLPQHQQQQNFGISIITRSKKTTNPNASFSLDLFHHSGDVQRHNSTLSSLETESNRLPDAIRKSLHHYHSVIKQFVTKRRYHLSAKIKDNAAGATKTSTTTTTIQSDAITNDQPIEPPLKHLIYALTATIDQQPTDTGYDARHIHGNARHHTANSFRTPFSNTVRNAHISKLLNQTAVLLQDLHQNYFNLNGGKTSKTLTIHHHQKRSTDLQEQQQQQHHTKSQPKPFDDDHFLNSKLQNYYFLYHIDNNNHFNLLTSPRQSNATQIRINKQRIHISNRQIDNALIDTTESDYSKYNPNTLHSNNNHSNHIKRIHLAKIASVCLNCNDDLPVKIYILPRSLDLTESAELTTTATATNLNQRNSFSDTSNIQMGNSHGNDDNDNGTDQMAPYNGAHDQNQLIWDLYAASDKSIEQMFEPKRHKKRFLLPIDSSLKNSLKNYPRIAGLLGNLSLAKITDPSTIKLNQNVRPTLHTNLHVFINDSDNSSGRNHSAAATLYRLIDANLPMQAGHSISFLKSPMISNNSIANSMHNDDDDDDDNNDDSNNNGDGDGTAARDAIIANISNYNYSPISTFEHYIRIISSHNINKHKGYDAIQTDGNKSKSLNFQHSKQPFKRVKKQQQIIQFFATNHRFIRNDTLNGNDNNTTIGQNANGQATDSNIVNNYKLNFTLNENNCTINVLNAVESASNQTGTTNQSQNQNQKHQQLDTTAAQENFHEKGKTVAKMLATLERRETNLKHATESMRFTKSSKKVKKSAEATSAQHQTNDAVSRPSNAMNSYLMRLESIKYQILMKLGLKQKPNITTTLPKHVIMDTLYRADDADSPQFNGLIASSFSVCI